MSVAERTERTREQKARKSSCRVKTRSRVLSAFDSKGREVNVKSEIKIGEGTVQPTFHIETFTDTNDIA